MALNVELLTFMQFLLQGIPLLYVPLEAVMSKYYGESERLLGAVFSQANELSDGAIIFLDEVNKDSCPFFSFTFAQFDYELKIYL